MRIRAGAAVGALVMAACAEASAQAPDTSAAAPIATATEVQANSGITSYPASFFAQFRPAHAGDMVQNVPGFTLEGGDDVRGFGGAAGNLLIDGERPTSKSVNLDNFLQRIPPENVLRIDIIRGGAPGIDMQGQSVVANVVRRPGATATRTLQAVVKPYPQLGFFGYFPRLEQSWRSGPYAFEGAIGVRRDKNVESGEGELIRRRASGAIFEQGDFNSDVDIRTANANMSGEYRGDTATYRLNGSIDRADNDRQEYALLTDAAGGVFSERGRNKTRADKAEIGGDYERTLNDWLSLRVLGLKTFKANKLNSLSLNRGPSQQSSETSTSGETILRSQFTATPSSLVSIDFGAEGAFNYLDARSSLIVGGAAQAIPSANVRVEEKRAEGFVTVNSKLGALQLETAARYETSTIRQTGGVNQSKTLSFLKPRVFGSYAFDPATDLRFRVERTVGQLNFKDFAASAEVDAGTVNAGNPDLEPERAWVFEGVAERRFWNGGALVLSVQHEQVSSVVDLIPIANRFDAPGNIGDGTRGEFNAGLTLPLDRLGLVGTVLRTNTVVRWSSVTDPVTGEKRRISLQRPFDATFQLSKSLPSLRSAFTVEAAGSGGAAGSGQFRETSYRISEIRTNRDEVVIKIIWDWTPRPETVFRFQIENALGKDRERERTLFTGPRSNNLVNFTEYRRAHLNPFIFMRLRQRL